MSRKPINFDDYSVANKEGVVVDLTAEGGGNLTWLLSQEETDKVKQIEGYRSSYQKKTLKTFIGHL